MESGENEEALGVIEWLEERLYEHNAAQLGRYDGALFSRVVRDENNTIIGGVAGWTWASVCEITQLWVHAPSRANGIGRALLEAAEGEAQSKGCATILVRSASYQAPHFYEKHGYRPAWVLKDFPPGSDYYILLKKLDVSV
jgi:ribosomal protein S18 acetylase RimI-like enzyme